MNESMGPRIGITIWQNGPTTSKGGAYAAAIRGAGGEPVWLPPATLADEGARLAVLSTIEGVLFSGGIDIHPRHFGEAIHEGVGVEIDEERDAGELPLAREALARGLPILGICRGIQTLNVAFGGTLYQDLSLIGIDASAHQQRKRPASLEDWQPAHTVDLTPTSRLAAILGAERTGVNSFHHQAVHRPAPGWMVTARALDGVIEGLEYPAARFGVAVQWHPERMATHDPGAARLFAAFVTAARR